MDAIDAVAVERWIGALVTLAELAESLPPPSVPVDPSGLASRMRTQRGGPFALVFVAVGCALPLVAALAAAAMLALGGPGR
jgi:hypothetical protein